MKRSLLALLAALSGLLAATSPASAQFTYPLQGGTRYPGWQTPLSPYLNMLRPGIPAVNYYALVQPEFQRRQDRSAIYTSIQSITNRLPPPPGLAEEDLLTPLKSTGHPTAFGYTGSYFGGGMGAGMGGRGASNPFTQRQQQGGRQAGPKNKWPSSNKPQPAGQKPKRFQ